MYYELLQELTLKMNELDCPLIEESHRYAVIPSVSVLHSISILHECGTSCTLQTSLKTCMEREDIAITSRYMIKHDKNYKFYCINSYCMNYLDVELL